MELIHAFCNATTNTTLINTTTINTTKTKTPSTTTTIKTVLYCIVRVY
jgi:hypothetical protein